MLLPPILHCGHPVGVLVFVCRCISATRLLQVAITLFWTTCKYLDKEQVLNQKNQQDATAPNHQNVEKVFFSREELQVLSDAIKKSKTRVSETKAASCAYHR